MIVNADNVIKFLELNNLKYWKVKQDDNFIFESNDEPYENNVERFFDVMKICNCQRLILEANISKTCYRGMFKQEFMNRNTCLDSSFKEYDDLIKKIKVLEFSYDNSISLLNERLDRLISTIKANKP